MRQQWIGIAAIVPSFVGRDTARSESRHDFPGRAYGRFLRSAPRFTIVTSGSVMQGVCQSRLVSRFAPRSQHQRIKACSNELTKTSKCSISNCLRRLPVGLRCAAQCT
jgi:hypothetical protein